VSDNRRKGKPAYGVVRPHDARIFCGFHVCEVATEDLEWAIRLVAYRPCIDIIEHMEAIIIEHMGRSRRGR
jgi:hypothetical protein